MTPEEYADLANHSIDSNDAEIKAFLLGATTEKIQRFIHRISIEGRPRFFHMARTALDIRLAEQAEISSRRLERQTRQLIYLTWALVGFTAALLILTFILVKNE